MSDQSRDGSMVRVAIRLSGPFTSYEVFTSQSPDSPVPFSYQSSTTRKKPVRLVYLSYNLCSKECVARVFAVLFTNVLFLQIVCVDGEEGEAEMDENLVLYAPPISRASGQNMFVNRGSPILTVMFGGLSFSTPRTRCNDS